MQSLGKVISFVVKSTIELIKGVGITLSGVGLLVFGLAFAKSCAPDLLYVQPQEIIGTVNSSMKSAVIERIRNAEHNSTINLQIESGGGSVLAGHGIILEMDKARQDKNVKFECEVNSFAGSMAFTILQHCDVRRAHSMSLIMQHMIHDGSGRENLQLDNNESKLTIAFLDKLHIENLKNKLEMNEKEFKLVEVLLNFSIWVDGEDALRLGIVDELVDMTIDTRHYERYDYFVKLYKKHKEVICEPEEKSLDADIDCTRFKSYSDAKRCLADKKRESNKKGIKQRNNDQLIMSTDEFCSYNP